MHVFGLLHEQAHHRRGPLALRSRAGRHRRASRLDVKKDLIPLQISQCGDTILWAGYPRAFEG